MKSGGPTLSSRGTVVLQDWAPGGEAEAGDVPRPTLGPDAWEVKRGPAQHGGPRNAVRRSDQPGRGLSSSCLQGTAELQKSVGLAQGQLWMCGWVGDPGDLRTGLENRKRERESVREEMNSLGVGPYREGRGHPRKASRHTCASVHTASSHHPDASLENPREKVASWSLPPKPFPAPAV